MREAILHIRPLSWKAIPLIRPLSWKAIPLIRPLSWKAILLIRPDVRCTEIVKHYLIVPLK
jgi:hypothetical protein